MTCEHPPKGFNTVPNRWQPEKTVPERSIRDQQKTSAWRRATSTVGTRSKIPPRQCHAVISHVTLWRAIAGHKSSLIISLILHVTMRCIKGNKETILGALNMTDQLLGRKTWELSVMWCLSMYFGDRYWMLCVGDNVSFVLIEALIKV